MSDKNFNTHVSRSNLQMFLNGVLMESLQLETYDVEVTQISWVTLEAITCIPFFIASLPLNSRVQKMTVFALTANLNQMRDQSRKD